jgi:hypothetical protein
MKAVRFLVGAVLVGAAFAAGAQSMSAPQREALNGAERWLIPVDNERYADAWAMAAEPFKSSVTREDWRVGIRKLRKEYGRVVIRKAGKVAYVGSAPDPNDPATQTKPGMRIAMLFDTKFAGNKQATEEVTMVLEDDGIWRVAGYYIK